MRLACRRTQRRLVAAIDGELESARLEAHLAACLRCQAEASRYRRIAREMAGLGSAGESAPPFLAPAVAHRVAQMAASEATNDPEASGSPAAARVAVAGALAAAAGTAVAVRLVRSRPLA